MEGRIMQSTESIYMGQRMAWELLGIKKTKFNALRKLEGFPKPRRFAGLLRWRKDELENWAERQVEGGANNDV